MQLIYHRLQKVFPFSEHNFPNQKWPFPPVHPERLVWTSLMEPISLRLVLVTSVLATFSRSPGRGCVLLNSLYSNKAKKLLCTWQTLLNGESIFLLLLFIWAYSIALSVSGRTRPQSGMSARKSKILYLSAFWYEDRPRKDFRGVSRVYGGPEHLSQIVEMGVRCEKQSLQQKFQRSNIYPPKSIAKGFFSTVFSV